MCTIFCKCYAPRPPIGPSDSPPSAPHGLRSEFMGWKLDVWPPSCLFRFSKMKRNTEKVKPTKKSKEYIEKCARLIKHIICNILAICRSTFSYIISCAQLKMIELSKLISTYCICYKMLRDDITCSSIL